MKWTSHRRPVWQPTRLTRLSSFLKGALKHFTLKRVALAFFGLPLLYYVYREVTHEGLVIDPISVPKQFEEAGLTPEVIANRVGNAMREIEADAQTKMKKDNLISLRDEGSIPDVAVPGTKLGLRTLVDITRAVLGVYPKHVGGDIVALATARRPFAKPQLTVTIYVTQGRARSHTISLVANANDVDSLAKKTAEMILVQVNPYVLAVHQYDHGEDEKAGGLLQSIIDDPSADRVHISAALNLLGLTLYDRQRYDEAIAQYRKAIELDPKFAVVYNNWGLALSDQKEYKEAAAKYWMATRTDPKLAIAYNNWGIALDGQGKYDEAIAEYQKATELDPKYADAYDNWGLALSDQRKYDEAIVKYQKAIDLDPADADAYDDWGLALGKQQKYEEAIAKYRKAIEFDSKYAAPYSNWGLALRDQGRYADAIRQYQKAIEINPKDPFPYNGWGRTLYYQKKYDKAIAQYRKAIEIDPKYADAYSNWGLALQAQGKSAEAEEKFAKANQVSQHTPSPTSR